MQKSDAERALRAYYPTFCALVLDGFADYITEYAATSHKHSPRTRANLIHDHIFDRAKQKLSEHSDFHRVQTKIRDLFDFADTLVLQFKKLTRNLRTSNILTQLTLDFNFQREVHLPGVPATLPRLTLGYVPKTDWTEVAGVYLTYCVGRRLVWYIDITQAGEQTAEFPQNLPFTPIPTTTHVPATHIARKFRAKHPKRKSGDASGTGV